MMILQLAMSAIFFLAAWAGEDPSFSNQTAAARLGNAVQVFPSNPQGTGVSVFDTLKPMIGGGAVGDFNNDGFQDLLFLAGGVLPDQLYMNRGNGTFVNRAPQWGVSRVHVGTAAAVGDFNADGWLDIYVTSMGPPTNLGPGQNILYQNTGSGSFVDVAAAMGVETLGMMHPDGMGATFGDYDRDGDLDLFVTGYLHLPIDNNYSNKLFRNDGTTFSDESAVLIGLGGLLDIYFGFSPRFVDVDGDLWSDLMIAGDWQLAAGSRYMDNVLDAQIPGFHFNNVTPSSGTGLDENGMGNDFADFNNDGLLDWYVTSIFEDGNPDQTGNKLYLADGIQGVAPFDYMHFAETAAAAGVDDGGWGWGTVAVDVNNDGFVDLVETNGWQNGTEWLNEQAYLFVNNGTTGSVSFTEDAVASGLNHVGQGRGMLNFDYDNDGDQDLVLFTNEGPLRLYRNDVEGVEAHSVTLFLDTSGAPGLAPNGVGSLVHCTAGAITQVASVDAGSNFLTQSELSAHFGLAKATRADEIRIVWLDGTETHVYGLPADQTYTIASTHGDVNGDGCVDLNDLLAVLGAFGACGSCAEDLNFDGFVNAVDRNIVIQNLGNGC